MKADLYVKLAGGQQTVGGYSVQVYSNGNSNTFGGSKTVDPLLGNYQFIQNTGAFTLVAPTVDCAIDILIGNNVGAGAITFSGFTVNSNTGEPLTTTNGHFFILSIRRMINISTYVIKALQ